MVKHIIQKRLKKNLTLDEYHTIQESNKINKPKNQSKNYTIDLSQRHKFKRSSQTIKEIDISIANKIEDIKVLPYSFEKDQIGSFFFDELENQRYNERSFEFMQFYHEIIDISQSLPLILHNLPKLVGSILSRLTSKTIRSSLLKLLPPLIRDCQSDIFKIFCDEILMKLLSLIEIQNLELLEGVFLVLAYGLKYLFSRILKDFKLFYEIYLFQLFGHKNKHIRKFAAESFSYILKKIPRNEIKIKLEIMFDSISGLDPHDYENQFDSLAELIYESIKFNNNSVNFSHKFMEIYPNFWDLVSSKYPDSPNVLAVFFKFVKIILKRAGFQNKNESNIIKTYDLTDFFSLLTENYSENLPKVISELVLKIFLYSVTYQKGRRTTTKILDYQFEGLLKISVEQEKLIYVLLGKICKYNYGELSRSSLDKLEQILFKNIEENNNNKIFFIVGLVFGDLFEESGKNNKNSEEFYEEEIEILTKNYEINKKVYEYCVIIALKNFQFKDLIDLNCGKEVLLKFYLFWMVHKFNNNDQMITIKNLHGISDDEIKKLEKYLNNIIKTMCDTNSIEPNNFLYFLTIIKIIRIIDFEEKIKERLTKILLAINEIIEASLDKKGFNSNSSNYDFTKLDYSDIYQISNEYFDFYNFDSIAYNLEQISFENVLLLFKTEVLKTYLNKFSLNFITDYQKHFMQASKILEQELKHLPRFRKNLGFLKYLSDLLNNFTLQIKLKKIDIELIGNKGIGLKEQRVYLKYRYYEESFKALVDNMCSNYSEIRLYSLKIMDFFEVLQFDGGKENDKIKNDSIFMGDCEVIAQLLKIESYQVNINTEREISLILAKIMKFVETKRMPNEYVSLLLNFSIGFSYVRFSTIWSTIKQTIFSCLNYYNQLFENYLKYLFFLNFSCSAYEKLPKQTPLISITSEIILNLNDSVEVKLDLQKIFSEDYYCENDSVNKIYVFETLHEVLSMGKALNERNKTVLLKYIKAFLEVEHSPCLKHTFEEDFDNINIAKTFMKQSESMQNERKSEEIKKLINKKMQTFLKILACFESLKNSFEETFFFTTILSLLRSNNEDIQKIAIQAISLFENKHINNYHTTLKKIQNKETFKSELLSLNANLQDPNYLTLDQRKHVMPVIISVLYPKIFSKKGKKTKKNLESNKSAIFNVFSSLNPSEMNFLLDLLLNKFQINLQIDYFELESKQFLLKMASFPISYWLGYLSTLENLIKSFSGLIYPFLKTLVVLILSMIKVLKLYKDNEKELTPTEYQKKFFKGKFKELNRIILKRFAEIYEKFSDYPEMDIITKALLEYKRPKIEKMALEYKGNDGLLSIFVIWSDNESYKHYFIEYSFLKQFIFLLYSAKKITQRTIELLNKIVLNLLNVTNQDQEMIIEENNEYNQVYEMKEKIFGKETVNILVENIQNHFISQKNLTKSKKKHWRPTLSLIKILLNLSQISQIEEKHIDSFLLMFLPLLDYKYLSKLLTTHNVRNQKQTIQREKSLTIYCEILKTFAGLLSIKKTPDNLTKYYNHICNLVLNLHGQKYRVLLLQCLKSLDLKLLGLTKDSVELLERMSRFEREVDRNYHYESVVPVILDFSSNIIQNMALNDIQLVLYHLFSLLEDKEMSLRGSALTGFKSFMNMLCQKWDQFSEIERKQIKRFISMMILPNLLNKIKKNVRSMEEYRLKSYYILLDNILEAFYLLKDNHQKKAIINQPFEIDENERFYLDLTVLLNKNDHEQNFFTLIFDLKISKKIKALNILIKKLREKESLFSIESINKLLLPLLNYLIFQKSLEINDPNNKMPKGATTISNYKTLLENSIEAFGLLTRSYKWGHFQKALKTLINMLERNENHAEKVVVKLICSLLNNLNFELNDVVQLVNEEMKKNKENMLKKISFFSAISSENTVIPDKNTHDKIEIEPLQQDEILIERNLIKLNLEPISQEEQEKNSMFYFLRAKVLVPLKHHMFEAKKNRNMESSDQKIRVFLTVAIVKLIRKFPLDMFLLEFPKVITNVSNSLKSRSLEVRDNARKALVEIIKILGPNFLYSIIKEMRHVLQLGYQKHVLNYSIYILLFSFIGKEPNVVNIGEMDPCLDLIMPPLLEEISGMLQEEKEAEEVTDKMLEMKKSKVNECFYMFAKIIDFENSIFIVINFIKTLLETEKNLSLKIINKCEEVLRNILEGLSHNSSVKPDHLLLFCYSLINESLKNMQRAEDKDLMVDNLILDYNPSKSELIKHNKAKTYELQQGAAQGTSIFKIISKHNKKNQFECARLFGNFALKLLISSLKHKVISYEAADILEKMNSVLLLIVSCLESNNNSMISCALKILYLTLKWPLPSIKKSYKKIMNSLLKILQNLSVNDTEMIQDTFKLLTELIASEEARPFLTEKQIKCVINYIETFVFSSEKTTEALECFNILIAKKFVRAEIYSLIEKIKEIMVNSYSRNFQNLCKEIYLNFLIEFPLSEKLIEKNLFFLIRNLEFEEPNGRDLISEILLKIITKFPLEVLEHFDETLFLALSVRIQNESVDEIQDNIIKTAKNLIERISKPNKQILYEHAFSWVEDSKIMIKKSGFDALKFFFEIFDFNAKLPKIKEITQLLLEEVDFEIISFKTRRKELLSAKRKLKTSLIWNEYLFKEEENELEKEKMNSKQMELIISLIDFYNEGFISFKNKLFFQRVFFKGSNYSMLEGFVLLLSHPNEKIVSNCLKLIETIIKETSEDFKEVYKEKDQIQKKMMDPLIRLFNRREMLEKTENSLFEVIRSVFEAFESNEEIIELNFLLLKRKMLKLLSKISEYNPQIARILRFIAVYLQKSQNTEKINAAILENVLFVHIKINNVEQHLKNKETETVELNEQIVEQMKLRIDSNIFFNAYSKVKNEIDQRKMKRKRVEKENLVLNQQSVAEAKLLKNLKKKRSKKNKILKFKGKTLFKRLKKTTQ